MVRYVIEAGPMGVELLCRVELVARAAGGGVAAVAGKRPVAVRHAGRVLPVEPGARTERLARLFAEAERRGAG